MNHTTSLHPRSRRLVRSAALTAIATLLATSGCTSQKAGPPLPTMPRVKLASALTKFDRCDGFLNYVKGEASAHVGPYGLEGAGGMRGPMIAEDKATMFGEARANERYAAASNAPAAAPVPREAGAPSTAAPASDTGTNNQESGVDEADIIKTDGRRIITIGQDGSELVVAELVDGAPYVTNRVDLGDGATGQRLFLSGDRAYVLADHELIEVSLSGTPKVTHRSTFEGQILDGRMANGVLRIVLDSPEPVRLGFISPNSPGAEAFATKQNRRIIAESTIEDWVPTVRTDGADATPLIDCDQLYRPAEFSGFSMLSVLTISDGLTSMTATGVQADGGVTYASTGHLYVATTAWASDRDANGARYAGRAQEHTDVHSFSIAGTAPASYEGSGRVSGHVLNQYSMSEYQGNLRLATTTQANGAMSDCPPNANCAAPMRAAAGDSRVTVLARKGAELVEQGMVDGLGVGEQIRSVRYVDDIAYVVTFRQTDPFYVIDLSDPAHPTKLGELKVPGFSAYLHPVGDHLVLGIGVDGTEQGLNGGGKLSLYDTSDPVAPREVATFTRSDLSFGVAQDSHAFHWDAERHLAYVPYMSSPMASASMGCCEPSRIGPGGIEPGGIESMRYQPPLGGVIALKVADGAITEMGRIVHLDRTPSPERGAASGAAPTTTTPTATTPGSIAEMAPMISRVFVVGDRVITLSQAGLGANDITTLRLAGFAAF